MSPRPSLALLTVLSLAIAAPAVAQTDDQPQDTRSQIFSPKGPGGRSITAFDRRGQSGVGGYYDLEFNQPLNGGPSSFDNHHLILQASSHLHDRLFFNGEVEFEHGGVLNNGRNDGELRIEQAWADYGITEALNLRAGVVLIPFGIVNVLHDSDVRETVTRPLMAKYVLPTTWSESGVGLHGLAYPTEDLQLTYEGYVSNGLHEAIDPLDGLHEDAGSLASDNNGNKAVSGRVALSPFLGLEVGLDGYYAAYDVTGTRHITMLGADAAYAHGPFELVGEYANAATEGGSFMAEAATAPTAIPAGLNGYYLEGRYRFFPELLHDTFLGRDGGFDQAAFTLYGRYGMADTNTGAYDGSDRNEMLIGLNYRPIQTFVTKLEYQRVSQPALGVNGDTIWSSVAVGF